MFPAALRPVQLLNRLILCSFLHHKCTKIPNCPGSQIPLLQHKGSSIPDQQKAICRFNHTFKAAVWHSVCAFAASRQGHACLTKGNRRRRICSGNRGSFQKHPGRAVKSVCSAPPAAPQPTYAGADCTGARTAANLSVTFQIPGYRLLETISVRFSNALLTWGKRTSIS